MYLTPFVVFFREQGQKETRVLTTQGYPGLPDDEYALIEAYCTDPTCDCRRVMLNVAGRHQASDQGTPFLASIGFGFDRESHLASPSYVARLESHYQQLKRAAANPLDPAHAMIQRSRTDENRGKASRPATATGAPKRATGSGKAKRRKKK